MIPTWLSAMQATQAPPGPIDVGPWDILQVDKEGFNTFSRNFTVPSGQLAVGIACAFSNGATPIVTFGGVTLTTVTMQRAANTLAYIAYGTGLPTTSAALTVTTSIGTLDGGAIRVHPLQNFQTPATGWIDGAVGTGRPVGTYTMTGTSGGTVKTVFVNQGADRYHQDRVTGAETVFDGYFMSGFPISTDVSTSGPWVLGTGWSVDGEDFVHTGTVAGDLSITFPATSGSMGLRADVDVTTGLLIMSNSTSGSGDTYNAPAKGYLSTAATGGITGASFRSNGECRLKAVSIVENAIPVAWVFAHTPAGDGKTLTPEMTYQPAWAFAAAELRATDA